MRMSYEVLCNVSHNDSSAQNDHLLKWNHFCTSTKWTATFHVYRSPIIEIQIITEPIELKFTSLFGHRDSFEHSFNISMKTLCFDYKQWSVQWFIYVDEYFWKFGPLQRNESQHQCPFVNISFFNTFETKTTPFNMVRLKRTGLQLVIV